MSVIPNPIGRTYMLRFNRGPILDLFGGTSLEAAMLARDLDAFDALDPGSLRVFGRGYWPEETRDGTKRRSGRTWDVPARLVEVPMKFVGGRVLTPPGGQSEKLGG